MDKYRVTLTTEQRIGLERLVSSGKAAARKLIHARILLLADTSTGSLRTDDDIVAALPWESGHEPSPVSASGLSGKASTLPWTTSLSRPGRTRSSSRAMSSNS